MDTERMLFTAGEQDRWEIECERLNLKVKVDMSVGGSYLVGFKKTAKGDEIYGLFAKGSFGGYIGKPVCRLHSAKMVLNSMKLQIKEIKLTDEDLLLKQLME